MTIAFIPARGGSKSIPLKNIKTFCGKPLIYWNLKALSEVEDVDAIYVSTDSLEIEAVVRGLGIDKVSVYKRSSENASDDATTESAILEFIKDENISPDSIFILAQATSPLTRAEDFMGAITQFKSSGSDSLLSCVRTKRFFWGDDGKPLNYDYENRPRRQDFKGTLMENGAFYISTVRNVLDSKNRISGKIDTYEMPEYTAIEIDEPEDWYVAETLMRRYNNPKSLPRPKGIRMFFTDVDGTLTDSGMYYSSDGVELKKFNTRDGKAFELLRQSRVKTGIITTEDTVIVSDRAKKLKADYLVQGVAGIDKLSAVEDICRKEGIGLDSVAYIGDDVNCIDLLKSVGCAACPSDAVEAVKAIDGIYVLSSSGGNGAVREFVELLL